MAFIGAGLGAVRTCLPSRAAACGRRALATMQVAPGTKMPLEKELMEMQGGGPAGVPLNGVFAGKKVVMFTVPGALTGTCTQSHAPEYVKAMSELTSKGVDAVVCVAVNDPFVMEAFAKKVDAAGSIRFLADGDASLTKALGIELETGAFGGTRAIRGSFVVEDGVFTQVNLEDGGAFEGPSKVATVLNQL